MEQSGPGSQDRDAQWTRDRAQEATPLPNANLRHYTSDSQRQADLEAAQQKNINNAAAKLGLTSDEWKVLRKNLGRSPGPADVRK